MDDNAREDLNFGQFEEEERNSGGLVHYVQEELGEHRSSSFTL